MPRIAMDRSGEMEVFARVVQEGGFSAAARSLDLTPSAVSKLIARLEARLGARLLVRTTRALTLTEEGEAFHHAATRIIQDLNDADQAASGGALRGRLRINASIPFGSMFVAPALRGFLENNPHLTVDLSLTDDIVDLLAQRADVAIRMGTLADSGLIARKLGESPRVICAAPAYLERRGIPQLPEDLAGHDCLTFNFRRGWPTWPFRQDGRNIEQPVRGNLIVNNGETMRQMTLAGVGIARLGSFHVAADISAGRLTPLLEAYNPGDLELISALYVGGGPIPHRVRVFIEYMAKALKQLSLG
ncbi:LysR family transcriptional regulator [Lichenifustis flavocetrariae]|uniref:LysR family transcriptional regulator n=1 Tax=Lichenifustis flavocetrariae TaxID=2949735 RepID=A0AA41YXC7_9HYPH|nr:LysR family transcriptional regulator [Lichenifustis flavocetrariae]MCW6510311.1 LysR family transcriptional regulator [Lichenifustis flavocetrariae]